MDGSGSQTCNHHIALAEISDFFFFLNSLQFEFFERTEYRIFFLASANLSPCHKTLEENPIYLPEPGTLDVRTSRKALGGSQVKLFQNAN